MALAIALGLMTEETNYQVDAKYVFWSHNPIGNMLHDTLESLVRLGILETKEINDENCYRWNPLFKGKWERGMAKIHFYEFWDVPRIFTLRLDCDNLLFDSSFDESIDDYSEYYKVYALPLSVPIDDDWPRLIKEASYWGKVKISDVKFDESKRREIDLALFDFFEWKT